MNLRTILMVCGLSLSAAHVHAAVPTLKEIDLFMESAIKDAANYIDSIGVYLNWCRPSVGQALSNTGEHLSNLNIGAAAKNMGAAANAVVNVVDHKLPIAPTAELVGKHMKDIKLIAKTVGVVVVTVGAIIATTVAYKGIKAVFGSEKSKKNS